MKRKADKSRKNENTSAQLKLNGQDTDDLVFKQVNHFLRFSLIAQFPPRFSFAMHLQVRGRLKVSSQVNSSEFKNMK